MTVMTEQKIIDLETRLAFQEAHIDALNLTISKQQQAIDGLQQQLQLLQKQLYRMDEQMGFENQNLPPPHY